MAKDIEDLVKTMNECNVETKKLCIYCQKFVTILFKPELMLFKNASSHNKEGWRIFV